ncbi:MAG: hypothetical protein IKQ56_04840 [Lachnospiraceae bacterium]|nr:hypothetical protein [Lachnospiraceae bacterium]
MGLTVYLSNTDIEVLNGSGSGRSVSVNRVYSKQMPEGSFLNGIITDPEGLVAALTDMWNSFKLPRKGIRLVINTPQISVRVLDMPIMNQSKADQYLQREFEERSGERKRLLGFYVVGRDSKKKTMKVCTELADVDFIDNYVQVFESAGISIKEINSGIGVSVNFLKKLKFAANTNSVIMIKDGMTVTAIYFVKGEYFYSTTARTFNSLGTLEYAGEISNAISQIVQFSKSEKVEDNIADIYLAGMTTEDAVNVYRAVSMNQSDEIKVFNLVGMKGVKYRGKNDSINSLFYPTAGLMNMTDQQNLLKFYGKGKIIDNTARIRKARLVIPYVVVILIMTGITVYRGITLSQDKAKLKQLQDYISNPSIRLDAAKYDVLADEIGYISDHVNAMRLLDAGIDSYPLPVYDVNKIVDAAAVGLGTVTIDNYNATTGVLGVTARFVEVDMINTFIDRLSAQDCFYAVNYTGYSEISSSGEWVANLECILADSAGR